MSYQNLPYAKLGQITYDKLNIKYMNEPEYKLKKEYNKLKIVLLIQDPHCIFAYWELPKKFLSNDNGGEIKLILRIINMSSNKIKDIELPDDCDNYYINVENINSTYKTELIALNLNNSKSTVVAESNCARNQKDYSYLDNQLYSNKNSISGNSKILNNTYDEDKSKLQDIRLWQEKANSKDESIQNKSNNLNNQNTIKFANTKDIMESSKKVKIRQVNISRFVEAKKIISEEFLQNLSRGESNAKGLLNVSSAPSSSICKASRV